MKINKKSYQFLLVGLLLIVFLGNVNADTYSFSVSSTFEDSDIFNFTVNNVGTIFAEATWTGNASNLALILNGPGQVGYYMQEDGTSPLSLNYTVTSADLSKGKDWRISIINFEEGNADGTVMITYPIITPTQAPDPTPAPTLAPHTPTPQEETPTPTQTPDPHIPTPQEENPGFLTLFSLISIFLVYYKNR